MDSFIVMTDDFSLNSPSFDGLLVFVPNARLRPAQHFSYMTINSTLCEVCRNGREMLTVLPCQLFRGASCS